MKLLEMKWRGIYRHNFRYKTKKWEYVKNDNRKSQYKSSELNSAMEN